MLKKGSQEGDYMRSLTRRDFVSLAISALASTTLAACSSQNSGSSSAANASKDPVTLQIFAANSLTEAMDNAIEIYKTSHPWVSFRDSQYLSSGDLNAQLQSGAYADVLISASADKMDIAQSKGLIVSDTRRDLFNNDLVVCARQNSGYRISSLSDVVSGGYKLAVGDESVPAGNYACQSLYSVGAYTSAEGRGGFFVGISPLLDSSVGNVCKHVQSGQVDLGIVYLSDLYRFPGLEIVYEIPESVHDRIIYPGAICTTSSKQEAAQEFLTWCKNDTDAISVWQQWGFAMA